MDSEAFTNNSVSYMGMPALHYVFLLMVVFQVKHFLADFPLQFPYMLRKSEEGWGFVVPLASHCGTHAILTLIICLIFSPHLWWLSVVDFFIHFIMDRIKSGTKFLGRFSDSHTTTYWTVFGFDQMVHHITHIYIIWIMVTRA